MKEFYGKYASASEARRAVEELLDRGYTRDQIRVVSRDDLGGKLERTHEGQHEDDRSVWEKIKDAFTFDEYDDNYWDRDHDDYNRAAIEEHRDDLQAGQTLVLVDHRAAETTHPMADGLDETTHADHDRAHMDHAHHDEVHHRDDRHLNEEERVMELHKEKLNVDKERVETGEVDIKKVVHEETQQIEVPVEREEIVIERRSGDGHEVRDGEIRDGVFHDKEEIHIPVSEERVDVSKKTVVDDEVAVKKVTHQDHETVEETVRHEEIEVEGNEHVRDAHRHEEHPPFDPDNKLNR